MHRIVGVFDAERQRLRGPLSTISVPMKMVVVNAAVPAFALVGVVATDLGFPAVAVMNLQENGVFDWVGATTHVNDSHVVVHRQDDFPVLWHRARHDTASVPSDGAPTAGGQSSSAAISFRDQM